MRAWSAAKCGIVLHQGAITSTSNEPATTAPCAAARLDIEFGNVICQPLCQLFEVSAGLDLERIPITLT